MILRIGRRLAASALLAACTGCAIPYYDVPYDKAGEPSVTSIVTRVQCELLDLVRNDWPHGDPRGFHRRFLLGGDYDVAVSLSLDVTNSGGLTPSLSHVTPLTAATSLTIGASGTLSQSRDHNFTENLQYSLRQMYLDWNKGLGPVCPPKNDTALAGELGIRDFVAMAESSEGLDRSKDLSGPGVFGGSIQFIVTKKITATGPTWALVNFKSIGALADLSQVHTDKITLAFAEGKDAGKPLVAGLGHRRANGRAHQFLQQLLTSSISTQLNILQNSLR